MWTSSTAGQTDLSDGTRTCLKAISVFFFGIPRLTNDHSRHHTSDATRGYTHAHPSRGPGPGLVPASAFDACQCRGAQFGCTGFWQAMHRPATMALADIAAVDALWTGYSNVSALHAFHDGLLMVSFRFDGVDVHQSVSHSLIRQKIGHQPRCLSTKGWF